MPAKHIGVNYRDSEGKWRHEKVWFPTEKLVGASGKTYKLGKYVNRGSNGTVFECFDPGNRKVAVKFLHQLDDQRLSRFDFEALVLSDLDCPHILPYIDGGSVSTTYSTEVPYLITSLFQGNLGYQVGKNGVLVPSEVKRHGLELLEALIYVHERGVIHRDIKPSNIFIAEGGRTVLGDFGIAKTATDAGAERYYREEVTLSSELVGPLLWLSPELGMYRGDKSALVDHRSDLFQVGLVIWYLLTGQIPRGGLDVEDDPTGGGILDVVQGLIKQRPERRFQSAKDAKAALEALQI